MRHLFTCAIISAVALSATPSLAQQQPEQKPKFLVKIDQVRLGFRAYQGSDSFKVGMWTPVFIDVTMGPKGMPMDPKNPPYIQIDAIDSQDVGTIYRVPVTAMEPGETRTFIGYTKPGNFSGAADIKVALHWDDKTFSPQTQVGTAIYDLNAHIYLSLGSKIADLRALVGLAQEGMANQKDGQIVANQNAGETGSRFGVFEFDPEKMPENWFGYQAVELVFLHTDKKEFLTALMKEVNRPRLKALAQWVRRGGRLVIPVHYQNQDLLAQLLQSPVWQPNVPVIPPANPGDVKGAAVKRLLGVENWARVANQPFPAFGNDPIPIAKLDPGQVQPGLWNVEAKTEDGRPLITRMPYGLGNITFLAFSLDQPPYTLWDGRSKFLQQLLVNLAPRVYGSNNQQAQFQFKGSADLTSELERSLDNFDVNVVPFGFVALFIILYILVVGPLDYFVLKHVFKKLELTWITFPTVVLAVSVAAYFTAYALKGNDLKINKVDVVDIDLRSEVDAKGKTRRAFAYGQTFFTILSPRIQNYTVGVEPNPAFWGGKEGLQSADMVSWMGRPENDGPGGMGRSGSQGFFRRPYQYADDAQGLIGLPIPVWTTKCLTASWEATLASATPVDAELTYHQRPVGGRDLKISGTIKNHLGVELEDLWLVYGGKCYPVAGPLGVAKDGGKGLTVSVDQSQSVDLRDWYNKGDPENVRDAGFKSVQGLYNPTLHIKQMMFFDKIDIGSNVRNHSQRLLDQSWRAQEELRVKDGGLREAILYGRARFQRGAAETVTANPNAPLATNVWLGALPGQTDNANNPLPRPSLAGTMAQDTYVRILLPLRPAE